MLAPSARPDRVSAPAYATNGARQIRQPAARNLRRIFAGLI